MELSGLLMDFGGVLTDAGDGLGSNGEPPLFAVLRHARQEGVRTALLSNADAGVSDPGWAELFDSVVLSGDVGVAKPHPEIYLETAERLGLDPRHCVFVDDLARNVAGAVAVGMVGVQHRSVRTTVDELAVLFQWDLPV